VREVLQMATCDEYIRWSLHFKHALLAEPLTDALQIQKELWRVLRAIALWEARSQHCMAGVQTTPWGIIRKILIRLCVNLKHFWTLKLRRVKLPKISRNRAKCEMQKESGRNMQIWNVCGDTLRVTAAPPRPHRR
jgi:hypothetical protein